MSEITQEIIWMIRNTSGKLYQAIADWQVENRTLAQKEIFDIIEEIEENANT